MCLLKKALFIIRLFSDVFFIFIKKLNQQKKCLPLSMPFLSYAREEVLALTFHYKFYYSLIFIMS